MLRAAACQPRSPPEIITEGPSSVMISGGAPIRPHKLMRGEHGRIPRDSGTVPRNEVLYLNPWGRSHLSAARNCQRPRRFWAG